MFIPNSPRPPRGTTTSVAGAWSGMAVDVIRCPVFDRGQTGTQARAPGHTRSERIFRLHDPACRHPGGARRSGSSGPCGSRPVGRLGSPENPDGSTTSGHDYSTARASAAKSARLRSPGRAPGSRPARAMSTAGSRPSRSAAGRSAFRSVLRRWLNVPRTMASKASGGPMSTGGGRKRRPTTAGRDLGRRAERARAAGSAAAPRPHAARCRRSGRRTPRCRGSPACGRPPRAAASPWRRAPPRRPPTTAKSRNRIGAPTL